jgi:uncharacterized protein (DUF362 family)
LSKVVVAKTNERSDLASLIDSSIKKFFGPQALSKLQKIVVKPNLCALMSPESGATTDPRIVESLVHVLKNYAPNAKIAIVESDTFERRAEEVFTHLGYDDLALRDDVELVNLTRDAKVLINIPRGRFIKKIHLPLTFLECDFFISVSKLKTHLFERYSGVLKNQHGCNPEKLKNHYHPFLGQVLSDVNSVFSPDFCILDGIIAMEGKGPTWGGKPKRMNVLLFSNDPVAIDTVGCEIMGINPRSVPHIVACYKRGIGTMKDIEVVGEDLSNVRATFERADKYTYYSVRMGLFLQRIANRFEQWGQWMIEMRWKRSRPFLLLPKGLKRMLKKRS